MNQSKQDSLPKPDADDDLKAAFEALTTYDAGSARGALDPLDRATVRAVRDPTDRLGLEREFIAALRKKCSAAAREYICSQLALIGSEASVAILAQYLADSQVSTSARNALEKIPGSVASKALRKAVGKLTGLQQIGAIISLGSRRDPASVALLSDLLKSTDARLASASAYALGEIGTTKAAKPLREFVSAAAQPCRLAAADAGLVCAERLLADGHHSEARLMYQALSAPIQPPHIQQAAAKGLQGCLPARSQMSGT